MVSTVKRKKVIGTYWSPDLSDIRSRWFKNCIDGILDGVRAFGRYNMWQDVGESGLRASNACWWRPRTTPHRAAPKQHQPQLQLLKLLYVKLNAASRTGVSFHLRWTTIFSDLKSRMQIVQATTRYTVSIQFDKV